MKWWLLKKVANEIEKNSSIFSLCRVGDNTFWLALDKNEPMLIDLANKSIETCAKKPISKSYTATIDVWLSKNSAKAKIEKIYINSLDKILEIDILSQNSYKAEPFTLRFELIPPRGSFSVLQNKIVICALRYDERIKIKKQIIEPTPPPRAPDIMPEWAQNLDLKEILEKLELNANSAKLNGIKNRKLAFLEQKITKLKAQIKELESSEELTQKSIEAFDIATYLETNLHNINSKEIPALNITLGHEKNSGEWKDFYHQKAKKLRQKANGVAARYENLEQKITFWTKLYELIQKASNENEIISLDPPKKQTS
ncbi:MAG: hypothetical protein RL154_1157, partial [Pseudomonadota bacterium]